MSPMSPVPNRCVCAAALATTVLLAGCGSSGGGPAKSSGTGSGQTGGGSGVTLSTLSGEHTTVTLDPAFLAKVTALHAVPNKYGTATLTKTAGSETLSFPITGGHLTVRSGSSPSESGSIDHSGAGLAIAAQGNNVVIDQLVVDPGANGTVKGEVKLGGKVLQKSVPLFDIDDSSQAAPVIDGKKITLSGLTVYVDPMTAGLLNLALGLSGSSALPTTKKSIKVGTATIVAQGT